MYRTVAQIDSLTGLLAAWFPAYFTRTQLPEASVQGRPVYLLRLRAGSGPERRGVLVVGGTHSRELMNPDAVVELAVDLFVAYVNQTDIVYGGRTWTAAEVQLVLETLDLWFLPCVNPDGREYAMTVDGLWRKNRRDNPGTPCDGVDLNRNFDVLWGVTQGQTSCSPCSDVYSGSGAFSEPETRNVKDVLDSHRIVTLVDVHSYSELVLWPWGHAPSQSTDPSRRFTTLPSGTCTGIGVPGYQESLSAQDRQRFQTVGARVVAAIASVRGRTYTNQPSVALYPVTGAQSDYAYSRHIADPALQKTYGFTIETGPWMGSVAESFHPADPEPVKRDVKSGLIALMQQSICAIELIGIEFFRAQTEVKTLRTVRDTMLATTEEGRAWVALFERIQAPVMASLLADEDLRSGAASLVRRAAQQTRKGAGPLTDDDVDEGVRFLRALAKRTDAPEVRRDLKAVERRLETMRGVTATAAVEELMRSGPSASRPKAAATPRGRRRRSS
jgi:murein tripeptide amidase MpaA